MWYISAVVVSQFNWLSYRANVHGFVVEVSEKEQNEPKYEWRNTNPGSPCPFTSYYILLASNPTSIIKGVTLRCGFMGHAEITASDNSFNEKASREPH